MFKALGFFTLLLLFEPENREIKNKPMETVNKIDILYANYVNNKDKFYKILVDGARHDKTQRTTFMLTGKDTEDELIGLYNEALNRSRTIERNGSDGQKWRGFAYVLRKIAQTIFNEYNSESKNNQFLRIVK